MAGMLGLNDHLPMEQQAQLTPGTEEYKQAQMANGSTPNAKGIGKGAQYGGMSALPGSTNINTEENISKKDPGFVPEVDTKNIDWDLWITLTEMNEEVMKLAMNAKNDLLVKKRVAHIVMVWNEMMVEEEALFEDLCMDLERITHEINERLPKKFRRHKYKGKRIDGIRLKDAITGKAFASAAQLEMAKDREIEIAKMRDTFMTNLAKKLKEDELSRKPYSIQELKEMQKAEEEQNTSKNSVLSSNNSGISPPNPVPEELALLLPNPPKPPPNPPAEGLPKGMSLAPVPAPPPPPPLE